jgi:hypothetical protein
MMVRAVTPTSPATRTPTPNRKARTSPPALPIEASASAGASMALTLASMAEQRVVPMFSYEDVGRAADWIAEAFGFEETGRWSDESGRVTHVNMELDGGVIMLGVSEPGLPEPEASRRGVRAGPHLAPDALRRRRRPRVGRRRRRALRTGGCGGRRDPVGARGQHRNRAAAIPSRGSRGPSLDVRAAALRDTYRCQARVRGCDVGVACSATPL